MCKPMTDREIKDVKDYIKAMRPEELAVVADTIPIELCLSRVQKDIERAKALEDTIRTMADLLRTDA